MTTNILPQETAALAIEQTPQQASAHHQAVRLESGAQTTEQAISENQKTSVESLPIASAAPQNSQNKPQAKPGKPDKSAKKTAAHKGKAPSPQEINTLVALFTEGRHTEAATLAQSMTERFPLHGFGWKVLGAVFKQMGRSAEALAPMQKAAALSPDDAAAYNNLGVTLQALGRLDEAEASYRRALQLKPDYAAAYSNLGFILKELGRLDEAEASCRRALQINPDNAEAHGNLGNTLKELGRLDEAEASYRQALQVNPDNAAVHSNLGVTLNELGRLDEAEASCRRALQINPDNAEAHGNLGNTLKELGRLGEAEASYRRALQINPDYAEAHSNLGVTLHELGRLDEAEASYRRALQLKPDYAAAYINLGITLNEWGRLDEVEASCRRALQLKPDYAAAYSNLLFCLSQSQAVGAQALFAEHCRFGEQFEAPLRAHWPQHSNSRDPERCLQVGFVSADLCSHAVSNFIEPILSHLAHYPQLSLHAYYNNVIEDAVTQRLQKYLTHWHPIAGLSDTALAEKIRADGIDILIDLSGHTAKNRLLAFARKPAPVQASWMGYPGTTGLKAIDYYLSDRFMLPEGKFDDQFTEKIVRLPANAPFLPSKNAPPVNTLPALSNGYVTFGSFNRPSKISRSVIALWSQLLRALPDSRMLLGAMPQDGKNDALIDWFAQEGIARERLSFHTRSGMDVYLGLHHQVDICLDTFPYNGGTTTCHALWMGIPTLTLAGDTLPGRVGAGILGHVDLEAFVAHDAADFAQKGLFWAGNLAALSDIRTGLRERFAQSAIGQPAVIAAGLERALRSMWQRWCDNLPPESFEANLLDSRKVTPNILPQETAALAIEQTLQQAIAHHHAGQLPEAEMLYQAILQIQPDHPEANHNMGVLAAQRKQPAAGLPYFMAALDADPTHGPYWLSYIDALFQAGRLEDARQVLALAQQQGLQGDEVEALAVRLESGAQTTEQAISENQKTSVESLPIASAAPQNSQNKPQAKPGKPDKSAKKTAAHKGKAPSPQEINTLVALFTEGRHTEAATLAQSMTERFPLHGFGWKVLGAVFKQMGRSAEALAPMQKAAALSPDDAAAYNNLGVTLQALGRLDEAEASYRRALQLKPDYAAAYSNLGFILKELGRLDEAEASCRRALQINPDNAEAHGNLGNTLKELGRLDEAEASYRQALQANPDNAEVHINLGSILQDLGRLDEAEASYRRALQIKPDYAAAYSNLLFCLSQSQAVGAQALFAEHCRFGEQFEAPLRAHWPQHSNSRDPERCLQVGFVSADLCSHAVSNFIEPILSHLAHYPQLSLHAYYNNVIEDAVTQRLQKYLTHWHPIAGLSDTALAEKIRADGIDILIDLSGHTAKNRLLAFARKPAPVQASWMGYPGTTGLKAIDYYLSDRFMLPEGKFDDQFTEKIVRLPANAPFLPSKNAPPVNTLPALSNGYVTFGSFNRPSKISRSVIALWSQLLRALPDSRMLLGAMPQDGKNDALIDWFAQEGIARERLSFHTRSGMDVYLGLHHQVDICLDTFPYNGGTTTCHALWMGIPTLTLAGDTLPGRVGAGILGHVDLEAFVAHDAADFAQKGLFWAGNLAALSDIRTGLRERFAQSAIGQPAVIAAGLERALRSMWQRWCDNLPPESFEANLLDSRKVTPNILPQETAALAIEQTLQQAIAHHHAGQLPEAEMLYQAILQIQPDHPEANHNMGVLAAQRKQPAAGLPYFMAALDADPTHGPYWLSYIDALFQAGRLEDARQVLALAQQQGLQGDEVEALAVRLESGAQTTEQAISENQKTSVESLPIASAAPQNSQNKPQAKPGKPDKSAKKTAAHKGKAPSPQEINTLVALFTEGRHTEAATLAQSMTERFPLHGFGWKVLGAVFKQMGRSADALAPMQKAAALSPDDADAHSNLGVALHDLGRLDEAEASCRRALQIKPDHAAAYSNLGSILQDMGRLDEAEASCRRALQINPNLAEAYNNLSNTLKELGRLGEAEASYRRTLQINPNLTEAHNNLGVTLHKLGRLDEAEASYRRALQIKPDYAAAYINLGFTLNELGRLDEAEANCRRALQINPDNAEALNNLCNTLKELGRLGEAEASYRRALQLKPDYADAHSNLGNTLQDLGRLDDAEASYRRALQLKPDYAAAYSNLLFCLSQSQAVGAQALFAEHCRFGEQFEAPLRAHWPQHSNSRDPERCLQVGFVSADLCSHAVSNFIEPILSHLAHYPQLSLHAYYNNVIEDAVTQRLQKYLTHWHPIAGLSDTALAEKIRADGIDILIDLSGHTAKNRLLAFARKPAPVQASWMGYPGTTGLKAIDYYLSDRFMLPEGKFDDQFTEKIVRLPANAPFLPSKNAPPVNTLPALSNGYVTFGSFNRPSKISRSVIALWSQLLRALPDSRMLLGAMPQDGKNDALIDWFAQEGIARERLSFHTRSGMDVYLGLHHQVDICLDTFPYNGGTTTCHALWMGIPTLTLAGDTLPGRVGAGILGHVDLEAFVAHDAADFAQKGLFWAGNLAALSDIRTGLRERFAQSAIGQPAVIAAGLERALRSMWQRWCDNLPPESFEVSLQNVSGITQEAGK